MLTTSVALLFNVIFMILGPLVVVAAIVLAIIGYVTIRNRPIRIETAISVQHTEPAAPTTPSQESA